jgi:hypothetical protein
METWTLSNAKSVGTVPKYDLKTDSIVEKQLDSVEVTKWIFVERISLNERSSDAGHDFYT